MSEIGYIKLYRSCKSNSFWQDKPFTRWQAFEDLILSAAFEQNRILLKGQVVMLERGQLIKGLDTFANDWGWSRKKVRTFLKLLENEKMAMSKGTPMGTLVTVVNYDFYQGEGPSKGMAKGPAEGNQRAIKGQSKGNKERNKEVKEVKNSIYAELPPALVSALMDFEEMRKNKRNPMTDRARELLLKRLNKLSGGDVEECIALLEESTEKGWTSVYPKKQERGEDRTFIGILSEYEDE